MPFFGIWGFIRAIYYFFPKTKRKVLQISKNSINFDWNWLRNTMLVQFWSNFTSFRRNMTFLHNNIQLTCPSSHKRERVSLIKWVNDHCYQPFDSFKMLVTLAPKNNQFLLNSSDIRWVIGGGPRPKRVHRVHVLCSEPLIKVHIWTSRAFFRKIICGFLRSFRHFWELIENKRAIAKIKVNTPKRWPKRLSNENIGDE